MCKITTLVSHCPSQCAQRSFHSGGIVCSMRREIQMCQSISWGIPQLNEAVGGIQHHSCYQNSIVCMVRWCENERLASDSVQKKPFCHVMCFGLHGTFVKWFANSTPRQTYFQLVGNCHHATMPGMPLKTCFSAASLPKYISEMGHPAATAKPSPAPAAPKKKFTGPNFPRRAPAWMEKMVLFACALTRVFWKKKCRKQTKWSDMPCFWSVS